MLILERAARGLYYSAAMYYDTGNCKYRVIIYDYPKTTEELFDSYDKADKYYDQQTEALDERDDMISTEE